MQKLAVTLREASALSGIGRTSFYKLFSQGKLTPRKAGKRTLILVAELERYINALPPAALGEAIVASEPCGREDRQ